MLILSLLDANFLVSLNSWTMLEYYMKAVYNRIFQMSN